MKTMVALLLSLIMIPMANARVGDEVCEKWAIYKVRKNFGEGDARRNRSILNNWHCSSGPNGNQRYHSCEREEKACIQWGPSPSQALAEKIGKEIGKNVANSLREVNTNIHEDYSQDVFEMINGLGEVIDNLAKTLINSLSSRRQ
jgi:hypothetical protein